MLDVTIILGGGGQVPPPQSEMTRWKLFGKKNKVRPITGQEGPEGKGWGFEVYL